MRLGETLPARMRRLHNLGELDRVGVDIVYPLEIFAASC